MDIRKGVLISRTNLVESKREMPIPWKGGGAIVFITLLIWAGVFFLNDSVKKNINAMQSQINSAKQNRDYQKIAYVADSESRLGSIRQIATERTDWEKILQKIEENTLPEITFSAMDGRVVTQNSQALTPGNLAVGSTSWQLDLKGTTVGIDMLSKQVLAYEGTKTSQSEPFAQDVSIQKIDIKKTESGETDSSGSIDFTIRVDINPNILNTSANK